MAEDLRNYEFWFAGEGPLKEQITLPNTRHLGYLNEDELIMTYNRATICVFPSYRENFPMVGLEALACGKATVATAIGFSEIIDHETTGLLINSGDRKGLAHSIQRLMENPYMRHAIERQARKDALRYNWRNIVKEYYTIFEK